MFQFMNRPGLSAKRLRLCVLASTLSMASGCLEQTWADYDALSSGETSTGSTTTAETDSGGVTISSITITAASSATTSDGTSSTSTGGDTGTVGEVVEKSEIIDVEVTPDPITSNGPIAVTVMAEHADGVRIELETGEVSELVVTGDDSIFQGEIAATSSLMNGDLVATLTPWNELGDGDPVDAPFTILLPNAGLEAFWESGSFIGNGNVNAIGVLPDGRIVEFGQRWVNGSPRCYLRRRSKSGAWSENTDVKDLLPGIDCAAVDIQIDAKGSIFVLAHREENGETVWWLGELPSWKADLVNHGLGAPGEEGNALALDLTGALAVCGAVPKGKVDEKDAAAWFFGSGAGKAIFNYVALPDEGFVYAETTHDCVLSGGTLTMVGESYGKYIDIVDKVNRHFILRYDAVTKAETWTVANADISLQSGATAVDVDEMGRVITAGYVCGDPCDEPHADLRLHGPDGEFLWFAPLGALPTKAFAPQDIAWSPAGYAAVALGTTVKGGNKPAFSVQAYKAFQIDPVWTFTREAGQLFQTALSLALGPYGEVYAGGLGGSAYPAFAIIHG